MNAPLHTKVSDAVGKTLGLVSNRTGMYVHTLLIQWVAYFC